MISLDEASPQLVAALTAGQIAAWVWDIAADRVFGDKRLSRFFNIPPDHGEGLPVAVYAATLHPDDRPRVMSLLARAVETGQDYIAEYRIVTFDPPHWVYARASVERDVSGRSARLAGVVIDVTTRHEVEEGVASIARQRDALLELQRTVTAAEASLGMGGNEEARALSVAVEQVLAIVPRAEGSAIEMLERNEQTNVEYLVYRAAGGSMARSVGLKVARSSSLSGRCLDEGKALICDDAETDARVDKEACRRAGIRSMVVVPIPRAGSFDGVLKVASALSCAFVEQDVLAVQLAVGAIATGLSGAAEARAVEAQRQSEARFRQLADAMPQIVWAAKPDGSLDYYNRKWFEYVNLPPDAGDAARWDRYIYPGDLERAYAAWTDALATGKPYAIEFRVRRGDGAYRWFLVRALSIRGTDGNILRWYGTCTDIHDQKLVEEQLRFSRQQAEIVVKGANVGVWYCPLPFSELIWDETVKAHFHLPGDAVVTIETFYERLHPDDRERTRNSIEQSIAKREAYDIDYRTVSPDGQRIRWIRAMGRGFYDEGENPTRFDGITIDVTQRRLDEEKLRASEARYADIMRTSLDAIVSMDHRGKVIDWNPAAKATFGYTAEEAIGREMAELVIPPELREQHRKGLAHYLASGEGPILGKRLELTAVVSGGRRIPIELTVTPATLANPPTFTAFLRDISSRKTAEEERETLLQSERAARAQAEQISRVKDEFLATLSHELRTPLNAILGWSQIMQGQDPADIAKGIQVIQRNARAQSQIIEDLLDMSRIISGKVRLDVQRLDIAAIVQAAVETARPTADAKGIRLQCVIDPLHGIVVSGDANRLQQVLWNLLSNAVKFTPKGGRVQVLLERVNSHIEISVIDTGEGISDEFLPFVFDRFRQADASTTRRHGGLGLGLSIVKQLIELHGGSVRVKSGGLGLGATFILILPLTVVHEEPEPKSERRHPRKAAVLDDMPEACVQIHGVRVLVVDDELDARALVKRILEDCQAQVTTAGSADEAITLLKQENFDVLVSDIGMPGEDGYALIRRVRSLQGGKGNIPAIALTAYARAEDRVRAISAGFMMHVAKPVESVELVTMVAGAAGRTGR